MKVFVTGASGFVGSAVVQELIKNGHQALGLARSDASAEALKTAGAEVHRGDLEDFDSLRTGAEAANAIIHCGFIHDFSRFKEVCEVDRKVITAFGDYLAGTNKPLIVTSGTLLVNPGHVATEDMKPQHNAHPRVASEEAVYAAADKGVLASLVRLSPSVHGDGDKGFVPMLIDIARQKGVSAYIGNGQNHWTGVHRLDAARLYVLALKNTVPGARFHGVAESDEDVTFKSIAEAIGKGLGIPVRSVTPEDAQEHFGWFAGFASIDGPASSKLTRERLGWKTDHVSLLDDIAHGTYFK